MKVLVSYTYIVMQDSLCSAKNSLNDSKWATFWLNQKHTNQIQSVKFTYNHNKVYWKNIEITCYTNT